MKIFLAGGTGVIGPALVRRLIEEGHEVTAITRKPDRATRLEELGAEPVVGDVLDADALIRVVERARPEVVIQHLTDLPPDLNPRNIKKGYQRNDRVRGEGSRNLVAAAKGAGAQRYVAQNVCFWYAPVGPWVVDESAPLVSPTVEPFASSARIHREMETRIVDATEFEGLVLRFGFWYGPGTTFAPDGYIAKQVRRRLYPIVGDGQGHQSFLHVDDVVEATIASLTNGAPGVYNVCDDDPAPMREWLPVYAGALGAKRPLHVPVWLARLVAGSYVAAQATTMRGASNEKAKRDLQWKPQYASWREGFRVALG